MFCVKEVFIKCASKRRGQVEDLGGSLASLCEKESAKIHPAWPSLHWKCLNTVVSVQKSITAAVVAGVMLVYIQVLLYAKPLVNSCKLQHLI